jgi:hypothetical protein
MREAIRSEWFVGLDVGQSVDPSALVVVERAECAGEFDGAMYAYPKEGELRVVHAERAPLGTSYAAVVERVEWLTRRLERCQVVVDATGVGRPVVEQLRGVGRGLMPVVITGGSG